MTQNYLNWYELNLEALVGAGYYQPADIEFINQDIPVFINKCFRLPDNFEKRFTKVMIIFPYRQNIFSAKPDRFYVDQNLLLRTGEYPGHIFNGNGFNDLSHLGWARFSLHLKEWSPTLDVVSGTTIFDILEAIYDGLSVL